MVGMAGRLLKRDEDVNIAAKITEGCVWAYKTMPSGIMPEVFRAAMCKDKLTCPPWDEKNWLTQIYRPSSAAIAAG